MSELQPTCKAGTFRVTAGGEPIGWIFTLASDASPVYIARPVSVPGEREPGDHVAATLEAAQTWLDSQAARMREAVA